MRVGKLASSIGVIAGLLLSNVAAAAPATRSGSALPAVTGKMGPAIASRALPRSSSRSNLVGAPLFIAFLGAIAVTIGTIVIISDDNDSPG
jgi:hypothetical protein